jgi:hypothetical protein
LFPRSSITGSPERNTRTHSSKAFEFTVSGFGTDGTVAPEDAIFQAVSAGRMRVAILPGVFLASAIACAPSLETSSAFLEVLTQSETGAAIPSMSEVRGAS